jgi:predicted ATP-grasp superfamily ATP-dependent carboligase
MTDGYSFVNSSGPMRILICEYTCAVGGPDFAALQTEGRAMLAALLEDFARLPGVTVVTMEASELGPVGPWGTRPLGKRPFECVFNEWLRCVDAALIIAPETDDILAACCRQVEAIGCRLLGPSSQAVQLTADKLRLADHWHKHGVRTPVTVTWPETTAYPLVCKPRYGAGSQATFLVRDPGKLEAALAEAAGQELVVQPFMPGLAASIAWLVSGTECVPLPAASQELSNDGRFHYLGGQLPLSAALTERAERVTRPAVESVAGLRGYVGVDVVLGAEDDGSADYVIELNPRLTTSYVGLHALARSNLAGAMLRAALGETIGALEWKNGIIRFTPEGHLA